MTLTTKELKRLMSELGKRKSAKKAKASRENGKLGGYPKGRPRVKRDKTPSK